VLKVDHHRVERVEKGERGGGRGRKGEGDTRRGEERRGEERGEEREMKAKGPKEREQDRTM